jgi:methylenetetrahydrofolate dehydrogenase (NADP+)/methenyltetrahydrofolate cyclohydrolase
MSEDKKIIDGNLISKQVIEEIRVELLKTGLKPGLALILVGNNPASEVYVKMKSKRCSELGFYSVTDNLPEDTSQDELLAKINSYNKAENIHGILIQLPLPLHLDETKIIEAIDYRKDVDGFHPVNAGRLLIGEKCLVPCTPAGIIELLKRYNVETVGKNAVVIGRSNIVGKPVANLLMQKNRHANSTVTVCHSSTKEISKYTLNADIIVAAIGRPNFLTSDMIKENCTIIDVGINRIDDASAKSGYRIVGDVNFESCYSKAGMITPVPGGVGPMTVAMLMKNTFESAANLIYP